jgi:hypothetical protein
MLFSHFEMLHQEKSGNPDKSCVLDKKWVGQHFGSIFSQTHPVTLLASSIVCRVRKWPQDLEQIVVHLMAFTDTTLSQKTSFGRGWW